ncbi:MAG: OmpL47-type beta-barrel domain-containing protein [Nocardioidaceae bacterium]
MSGLRRTRKSSRSYQRQLLSAASALAVALAGLTVTATTASAAPNPASVSSVAFTGGTGTAAVGGTLYARQGATLTLTVTTSGASCVDVAGAFSGHQSSTSAQSTWTFSVPAGAGDGAQSVTATASPSINPQGSCTGNSASGQAGFVLDNTGPAVTGTVSPTPNAAGWNNSSASIAWAATDAGSGVATGPTPATDSVTNNTGGTQKTSTATDRVGNSATGSVTVKLDKIAPTITGSRSPAANGNGWNNTNVVASFTCSDAISGIKSCQAPVTVSTEGSNQSVTGNVADNADNTASATATGISIDKTAPTLSGAPTTQPNANNWYRGDVTIAWKAADALSGVDSQPGNSTITGEGTGLTAMQTVVDRAGNNTSAFSSPAVRIDRTAPVTGITGASNAWSKNTVAVTLSPSDNLSGVASTTYTVDGGAAQSGTSFTLSNEGDHVVTWWSTDVAGNVESTNTAHVKIDKTAPTITHAFLPQGYVDGAWTNHDVTVTFTCADGTSGVASCPGSVTKSSEGGAQLVSGTATDNAGNSATDTASVSIDKTPPTISGAADRPANAAHWYNDDVVVGFTADDALSGLAGRPASVTLGEGANQSATGTATDAAGNSASATVSGINVDKTKPVLSADPVSGWHQDDVVVHWSCLDGLSGVAQGPTNDTVTGEGDDLTSSAACTDLAGNTATASVSGIKIDRTAPSTSASVPDALPSGWYAGPVLVTLTGDDALSGVAHTYYSVDGGARQDYKDPFSFATKGEHTITFWSTDGAGNTETAGDGIVLRIDGNPPTTTLISPISPASGWFVSSGLPVAFDAQDAESGIAATYFTVDGGEAQVYGERFTQNLSDGTHTLRWWSVDVAGNVEDAHSVVLNVDTVPPTITGAQSPAANTYGWNNSDVSVTFSCTDSGSGSGAAGSGVAGCAGDTVLSNETSNDGVSVRGDAVDTAGNKSTTSYGPVKIDKTAPTLVGAPTTDPNAAKWYNGDVVVAWAGSDALSGIDPLTQPANSTITGEGKNLGAGPVTIFDKAGSESLPASVSGINIDRTAPVITGGPTTPPNDGGWYKRGVVVDFGCTDNLSGVAHCPTSQTVDTDGANQQVTSGPAADLADNVAPGITVDKINVDGAAPTSKATTACTLVAGWCTGTTASVVINATDQAGLSGVAAIHYRVDGGTEQVVPGDTTTVSVPLSGTGAGTVAFWAVDGAGNVEQANTAALKWDNIAPTVTHTVTPTPNAGGWNKDDATVHFDATDDQGGSGVDASTVTPDVTVGQETPGQLVSGEAKDTAGNRGTDSVKVMLDKTKPTITAAVTAGAKGSNGWYVGPVTVTFTCDDALSGVVTCPDPTVLTANGTDNSATGTVTDRAGNTASTTLGGIKIDREKPTIGTVNVDGQTYTLGAVPAPICTASDSVSGSASCTVTVTGGNANGVGTFTWTATATDNAGNTATRSGTYKVIYRYDGFLQPINDTAHQVGTSTSIFKAGSTIPAKLQLKKADGTVVQSLSAPVWLAPVKGSSMSAAVDESLYSDSADSGTTYRFDTTAQQYVYNWKTDSKSSGYYWRIGVKLDDGCVYYVNIGLK